MESMRDVLKRNLNRSLDKMAPLDRLEAAWPVACGKAMAGRGRIAGFAEGVVTIAVQDPAWLDQMRSMREILSRDLARIAGVPVKAIHFEQRNLLV